MYQHEHFKYQTKYINEILLNFAPNCAAQLLGGKIRIS